MARPHHAKLGSSPSRDLHVCEACASRFLEGGVDKGSHGVGVQVFVRGILVESLVEQKVVLFGESVRGKIHELILLRKKNFVPRKNIPLGLALPELVSFCTFLVNPSGKNISFGRISCLFPICPNWFFLARFAPIGFLCAFLSHVNCFRKGTNTPDENAVMR